MRSTTFEAHIILIALFSLEHFSNPYSLEYSCLLLGALHSVDATPPRIASRDAVHEHSLISEHLPATYLQPLHFALLYLNRINFCHPSVQQSCNWAAVIFRSKPVDGIPDFVARFSWKLLPVRQSTILKPARI